VWSIVLSWLVTAPELHAASSPPVVVSVPDQSLVGPATGNGDSTAPRLTPDGRFVLFVSTANNLVVGDNSHQFVDVFVRDRASNSIILVSANLNGTGGGNGNSGWPSISADGRYVVFESGASDLVANDTNGVSDIFVRDLLAGTTRLVSIGADGSSANGVSRDAVITPSGRYVAFISSATNLVAGDTNKFPDVFVRDLVSQTTLLASVGAFLPASVSTGTVSSLNITPDGRFVSFLSTAAGLAPGVSNRPAGEVYVRDMALGKTTWASTNAADLAHTTLGLVNAPSYHPVMSDDGRFVAFKTGATNGNGWALILHYDTSNTTTTIVTTDAVPAFAYSDDLYGPEMTPDGRFIAFARREGATNSLHSSLYLWDRVSQTVTAISPDQIGQVSSNAISRTPALNTDGRFVAFVSDATNLVSNTISSGSHVYLRDTTLGSTTLIDVDTNGSGTVDSVGAAPALSADGRLVAWSGPDGRLVPRDSNGWLDVFVRDTTNSANELISAIDPVVTIATGDGLSTLSQFSISADSRFLIFASHAENLVPGDTNHGMDVFVRDLAAGATVLVSAGTNELAAQGGDSGGPVISANGRFAAFVSTATNLVASPITTATFHFNNIYRRDLQTGTNVLVTANPSNTSLGQNDSIAPLISQAGRYVAFLSKAANLVTNSLSAGLNVFWRDVDGGATVALTTNGLATNSISMSADGRFVAWFSGPTTVTVRDMQAATNIYTTPGGAGSAALSPAGDLLAWQGAGALHIDDVVGKSNRFSFGSGTRIRSGAQWSGDGRFFAFVTATNLLPADTNGTNDVYLCDTRTGAISLLSLNFSGTASATGPSDWPVVNGDGSFVAFRSFASNVVPAATSAPSLYVFSRYTGTNLLLGAAQAAPGSISWLAWPSISANGGVVSFKSWAAGLVSNDLNRSPDVFENLVDSDGDGIPDWWMVEYFGHPTGLASDASRAGDDPDVDGESNFQEYIAGTDPTNSASVFKLQVALIPGTNGLIVNWPSSTSSSYRVQYKDDLQETTWQELTGVVSIVAGEGSFEVQADAVKRFYRVRASR
jgi:Tol biopolymer transport system component